MLLTIVVILLVLGAAVLLSGSPFGALRLLSCSWSSSRPGPAGTGSPSSFLRSGSRTVGLPCRTTQSVIQLIHSAAARSGR
ncbi:MAG: hypothetical protein P4L36_00180 [Holophaga sp.]|nr:hypothetical protein [Holophaga sp.]